MTQVYDWPGREDIAARAAQRWRRRRPLFVAIALVGGAAGAWWGSTRHQSGRHHHSSTEVTVIVGVTAFAVVAGVIALAVVVLRTRRISWQVSNPAPIALGLPRPQRREVARAIRRGVPSTDPTLFSVERESAERVVQHGRISRWVLPVVIALELINAFTVDRGTRSRVFFVLLAVVLLSTWLWTLVYQRGAGRLLAASRAPD